MAKTRRCLACFGEVEKVGSSWVCSQCGSHFKLRRVKKEKRYTWTLFPDDANGGITEKGQQIMSKRLSKAEGLQKYVRDDKWQLITNARQFPTVYRDKDDDNHFRVLMPPNYSGFLYCPSCGKKAQQTTLASGILEYKCRNTKGNKKCGALVEFHLGGELWNND